MFEAMDFIIDVNSLNSLSSHIVSLFACQLIYLREVLSGEWAVFLFTRFLPSIWKHRLSRKLFRELLSWSEKKNLTVFLIEFFYLEKIKKEKKTIFCDSMFITREESVKFIHIHISILALLSDIIFDLTSILCYVKKSTSSKKIPFHLSSCSPKRRKKNI